MSNDHSMHPPEQLLELLAARAAGLLSADEANELESLLRAYPGLASDELDLTAAAVDLALGPVSFEPLPAQLRARLTTLARQQVAAVGPNRESQVSLAPPPARAPARASTTTVAWLLLAASLLLALWGWWPRIVSSRGSTLAEQRAALLKRHSLRVALTDPTSAQMYGDIVWSDADQQGYMHLTGLKPNDPSREQYQLWIFDENQDDRYPVDGGVFNVERDDQGEVIVPIHPAIRVGKATMFAITVEKPGGVVVSDRQHIAALGKIDG